LDADAGARFTRLGNIEYLHKQRFLQFKSSGRPLNEDEAAAPGFGSPSTFDALHNTDSLLLPGGISRQTTPLAKASNTLAP
jgi:hypothetical protein